MIFKYLILTVKRRIYNTPTYQIIFWAFAITIAIGLSIYLFNTRQYFYIYCMESQSETRLINRSSVPIQNIQPQIIINNYEAAHPQVLRGNFFIGISVGVAVGVVVFALV
jgi:hypothetical protein